MIKVFSQSVRNIFETKCHFLFPEKCLFIVKSSGAICICNLDRFSIYIDSSLESTYLYKKTFQGKKVSFMSQMHFSLSRVQYIRKRKKSDQGQVPTYIRLGSSTVYMSFDKFLWAVESCDLSQADKSIRVSSFPKKLFYLSLNNWGLNFLQNECSQLWVTFEVWFFHVLGQGNRKKLFANLFYIFKHLVDANAMQIDFPLSLVIS